MASITGPQILLHSRSPSLKLKLKPSSAFLLFQNPPFSAKYTRRAAFCTINANANANSNPQASTSIVPDLLQYLNHSWTQFHATAEAKRQLLAAGFHMLNENQDWDLKPGGRYFFTRNMSCLVAFAVGEKYNVGDGFHVIAAHTDSPCLKLKPKTASCKCNYSMVNVQTYGAGLWYTWFDRDLSVAGRVILRNGHNSFVHKLVKVDRPILRIPTLAIHLDRNMQQAADRISISYFVLLFSTVNQDGFKPNLETHLLPLLSIKSEDTSLESKEKNTALSSKSYHHSLLMQSITEQYANELVSLDFGM